MLLKTRIKKKKVTGSLTIMFSEISNYNDNVNIAGHLPNLRPGFKKRFILRKKFFHL